MGEFAAARPAIDRACRALGEELAGLPELTSGLVKASRHRV
jgi:hypothetical protein